MRHIVEQLLRDGWVVLAGDLKKKRSVYKITGYGMQRYATLVVALQDDGTDEKTISKKSMLGGPKLSKLTADKWPNAKYEDVVRELGNNGMLTESVDGLELSEKGMNYVKTMFDVEGKPKSDPLEKVVGNKKGDDKISGYMLKAVTFMGKIADAGAKMDKMVNGTKGGIGAKKKYSNQQSKSNIINNYYNYVPKKKAKPKEKAQKKQTENFNTDYSKFYKIG